MATPPRRLASESNGAGLGSLSYVPAASGPQTPTPSTPTARRNSLSIMTDVAMAAAASTSVAASPLNSLAEASAQSPYQLTRPQSSLNGLSKLANAEVQNTLPPSAETSLSLGRALSSTTAGALPGPVIHATTLQALHPDTAMQVALVDMSDAAKIEPATDPATADTQNRSASDNDLRVGISPSPRIAMGPTRSPIQSLSELATMIATSPSPRRISSFSPRLVSAVDGGAAGDAGTDPSSAAQRHHEQPHGTSPAPHHSTGNFMSAFVDETLGRPGRGTSRDTPGGGGGDNQARSRSVSPSSRGGRPEIAPPSSSSAMRTVPSSVFPHHISESNESSSSSGTESEEEEDDEVGGQARPGDAAAGDFSLYDAAGFGGQETMPSLSQYADGPSSSMFPEPSRLPARVGGGGMGLTGVANRAVSSSSSLGRKKRKRSHLLRYNDIQFTDMIGKGSFGDVYRGTLWGQEVACKVLRKGVDQEKLKEFMREVNIMKNLRHPNIVEFLGASIDKGKECIVTEFLSNGSLEDLLEDLEAKHQKLSNKRVLAIAKDIARGLNWLHHKGIIHRDLKPANLLVDSNKKVKLADFGLSHVLRGSSQSRGCYGVYGTPCYMAPEVIEKRPYGVKADVFSFAIILCELVTGKYPYDEAPQSTMTFENAIVSGLRPEVPDCPPAMQKLITDCWEEDPEDRPSVDQIMETLFLIEEQQKAQYSVLDEMPEEVRHIFELNQKRVADLQTNLDNKSETVREQSDKIDVLQSKVVELQKDQRKKTRQINRVNRQLVQRTKDLKKARTTITTLRRQLRAFTSQQAAAGGTAFPAVGDRPGRKKSKKKTKAAAASTADATPELAGGTLKWVGTRAHSGDCLWWRGYNELLAQRQEEQRHRRQQQSILDAMMERQLAKAEAAGNAKRSSSYTAPNAQGATTEHKTADPTGQQAYKKDSTASPRAPSTRSSSSSGDANQQPTSGSGGKRIGVQRPSSGSSRSSTAAPTTLDKDDPPAATTMLRRSERRSGRIRQRLTAAEMRGLPLCTCAVSRRSQSPSLPQSTTTSTAKLWQPVSAGVQSGRKRKSGGSSGNGSSGASAGRKRVRVSSRERSSSNSPKKGGLARVVVQGQRLVLRVPKLILSKQRRASSNATAAIVPRRQPGLRQSPRILSRAAQRGGPSAASALVLPSQASDSRNFKTASTVTEEKAQEASTVRPVARSKRKNTDTEAASQPTETANAGDNNDAERNGQGVVSEQEPIPPRCLFTPRRSSRKRRKSVILESLSAAHPHAAHIGTASPATDPRLRVARQLHSGGAGAGHMDVSGVGAPGGSGQSGANPPRDCRTAARIGTPPSATTTVGL